MTDGARAHAPVADSTGNWVDRSAPLWAVLEGVIATILRDGAETAVRAKYQVDLLRHPHRSAERARALPCPVGGVVDDPSIASRVNTHLRDLANYLGLHGGDLRRAAGGRRVGL